MRIATWNVERLKHHKHLENILQEIRKIDADILVLTETDARLNPNYSYCYCTPPLYKLMPDFYQTTENRVSIFSKYRAVKRHETYDPFTAICVEMETSHGNMLVYGTIIGIMGNREASFKKDLEKQMEDIRRLSSQGYTLCVVGDYNLSFHDNYYYTREGRNSVNNQFHSSGIELISKDVPDCVDHIAVTKGFFESVVNIQEWNLDKTLSDHKGISIDALPAQLAT